MGDSRIAQAILRCKEGGCWNYENLLLGPTLQFALPAQATHSLFNLELIGSYVGREGG